MFEKILSELSIDFVLKLFGTLDSNTEKIENEFGVTVSSREGGVRVSGNSAADVNQACECITQLSKVSAVSDTIDENTINYIISMVREDRQSELSAIFYKASVGVVLS